MKPAFSVIYWQPLLSSEIIVKADFNTHNCLQTSKTSNNIKRVDNVQNVNNVEVDVNARNHGLKTSQTLKFFICQLNYTLLDILLWVFQYYFFAFQWFLFASFLTVFYEFCFKIIIINIIVITFTFVHKFCKKKNNFSLILILQFTLLERTWTWNTNLTLL